MIGINATAVISNEEIKEVDNEVVRTYTVSEKVDLKVIDMQIRSITMQINNLQDKLDKLNTLKSSAEAIANIK